VSSWMIPGEKFVYGGWDAAGGDWLRPGQQIRACPRGDSSASLILTSRSRRASAPIRGPYLLTHDNIGGGLEKKKNPRHATASAR